MTALCIVLGILVLLLLLALAPVGVRDESRNATGTQKLYADV